MDTMDFDPNAPRGMKVVGASGETTNKHQCAARNPLAGMPRRSYAYGASNPALRPVIVKGE